MKQFKTNAGRFGVCVNFLTVFLFSLVFSSSAVSNESKIKTRKAEIYRVYDIKVDEISNNAEKAQNKALITGRRAALSVLFKKILAKDDVSKVPYLSNNQIEELSTGFAVSHEKRSNVRYMANLSFYFDQDKIHDIFALLEISSAELYAEPIAILPILKENGEYYIWGEGNIWRTKWREYDYKNELISLNAFPHTMEYEVSLSPAQMQERDIKSASNFTWEKAIEDQKYDMRSYEIFSEKFFAFNSLNQNSSNRFYVAQVNIQRLGKVKDMKLGLTIYSVQKDNENNFVKPVFHKFYGVEIDQDGKSFVIPKESHIKIVKDEFLKFDLEYYSVDPENETERDLTLTLEEIEAREYADLLAFEETLEKNKEDTEVNNQDKISDMALLNPSSSANEIPTDNDLFDQAVEQLFEAAQKDIIEYFSENWKEKTLVDFTKIQKMNIIISLENSKTWFSVQNRLNDLTLMSSVKLINLNIKKANIAFNYMGNIEQLKLDMKKHNLKFERLLTEEQMLNYQNELKMAEENIAAALGDDMETQVIKKPTGLGSWSISLIK